MRALHVGLRVHDLGSSLDFYTGLGYEVVGTVPETEFGVLTMLQLPMMSSSAWNSFMIRRPGRSSLAV